MLCLTTSVYIFMLHQRQHFQSNMEAAQHKLCELKPAIPYNRISFEKLEKKCKRKEKLYSEDLVQHHITIIISCRMKTEIQTQKCIFYSCERKVSLSTGRKLQSTANNQQCPPDFGSVQIFPWNLLSQGCCCY